MTVAPAAQAAARPEPGTDCRCAHPKHRGACPDPACGCVRYRRRAYDRLLQRALAVADEHPSVAMKAYDDARPRSRKTATARAEGRYGVGASDMSACRKAIEFRERPPEDYVPNDTDKSAAYLGTAIDEAYKRARRRRYPWRQFDVPIDVPGLDWPVSGDEYDPLLGRIIDYKSRGEYIYEQVGRYGPPESEWAQLATYGLGLEDAGERVTELEIISIRRANGETETFRRPYSRAVALKAVGYLVSIIEALEAGQPLPRDRSGPSTDPICASYCAHRNACWDIPAAEAAGRSPEGWMLARDDEGIAAALEVYDRERAVMAEHDKAKKHARALLDGVEAGRYGDHTIRWTGGGWRDVPDVEQRIRDLETALGKADPDALAEIGYPTKSVRSNVNIEVKRVRVATLEAEAAPAEAAAPAAG